MSADGPLNGSSLPLSQLEHIDLVCDRFEAAWRAGQGPRIERYLDRDRTAMLRRLLALELELRRECGERPAPAEYHERFPQDGPLVESLVHEPEATGPSPAPGSKEPAGAADWPRIAGYDIRAELGRGGMGVVYLARQVRLDRLVALKMVLAGAHATAAELARSSEEARVVAQIQHPHIVQIHEVGDHQGLPYLSLEFVEGGSLAERIDRKPQPILEAARVVMTLARAMQVAHDRGVVHRDLKPANVLLKADGTPKITDFGLAKRLEADSGQTRTGSILGTPSYMAPEQARGLTGRIGPPADQYALGAILYEMLTGRPPFQGTSVLETLDQVRSQEPVPPRRLRPKVPRDLETICLKCLEKDPRRRYPGASGLADDLERFLLGEPIQARPILLPGRILKRARRRPAIAAMAALLILATTALLAFGVRNRELRKNQEIAEARALTAWKEGEIAEARALAAQERAATQRYHALLQKVRGYLSKPRPIGREAALNDLAEAARLPASERSVVDLRTALADCVAVVDLRRRETWPMPENAQVDHLAFSPDGRRLAMAQLRGTFLRQVRLVDLTGGSHQDLTYPGPWRLDARDTGGGSLAFSPDGRWLVLGTRQGELYAWDTTSPRPRRSDLRGAHSDLVDGLAFHPDGKTLISGSRDKTLRRWDLASGWKPAGTIQLERPLYELAVSPDGTAIACCTPDGLIALDAACAFSSKEGASRNRREFRGRTVFACYSPDGRFLASTDGRRLVLLDPASLELIRTLGDADLENACHEDEITNIQFDSGGSLLISAAWDRTVKLWEAATGRLLVVSREASDNREIVMAALSPEGRRLAVSGGPRAVLYELDGLEELTIAAQHAEAVRAIDFAPDGKSLACVTDQRAAGPEHRGALTIWDVESGRLRAWRAISGRHRDVFRGCVAFHPDGTLLAYSQSTPELSVVRPGPANPRTTRDAAEPPSSLAFSRDGRTLWAGAGRQLISWRMPELSPASRWSNDEGEYWKGWSGIVAVAAGHEWVVAGSDDDNTRVFRMRDGAQPVRTWPSPGGSISSVALSRDETLAVSGTRSGRVRVARVPGGEPVADLEGHTDDVTSVVLSPDDRVLATASRDRTIRLWQRRGDSFRELLSLGSPSGGVVACRFRPDGRKLAFLVKNETAVRIWHLDRLERRLDAMNLGWRGAGPG